MRWLFPAFLIVPALEIGLFVWAGGWIGPWWIVILILLTGIIGVSFARQQGIIVWNRAKESMSYHQVPGDEIVDGICIFIGALFLFTPGFITDAVGFFLVLPWTRQPFKAIVIKWLKYYMTKNSGKIIYRKW
ncbi:FxsA family protein [Virgibacillus sp. W0181]|uniref:FxsA family protein n=1 Tax=Virgibacillus sp. W0181 TaxID=3391581 RepID=UPI003F46D5EA